MREIIASESIDLRRNLNPTFAVIIVTALFIVIICNLNSSFALPYSNYTSNKYQIQFQYPYSWEIIEKNGSLNEIPGIEIIDPSSGDSSSGDGYFYIYIRALSDDEAYAAYDSNIRVITEIALQSLHNDSSIEYYVLKYPSYLTIDGHDAGTFVYIKNYKSEGISGLYTAQPWTVLVGDRHYILSFFSKSDFFNSVYYIEIRDKFINSIKFLAGNVTNIDGPTA